MPIPSTDKNPKLVQFRDTIAPPVTRALSRLGFSANVLTLVAFLLGMGAVVAIGLGRLPLAFWLLLVSVLLDILDGTMARTEGTSSDAGAFLDSILDRYVDMGVFLGIAWYGMRQGNDLLILASFLALVGATVTSYAAARAGSLGVFRRVGWLLGRLPRAILMLVGIGLPSTLYVAVWLLAALGNYTALQRLFIYMAELRKKG